MKATKEQALAINTIEGNVLVNAGAGTGKTKVLTERYIKILEEGNLPENREVESIVAITFTKKATQEMKERIRASLRENFSKGEKWRRFYMDMEKANISTIHSFCGNILRENPLEAGIDPVFQIIEEARAEELLRSSMDQVLETRLHAEGELFNFINKLGQDSLDQFREGLREVYSKSRDNGMTLASLESITLGELEKISIPQDLDKRIVSSLDYLLDKINSKKFKDLSQSESWIKYKEGDYREGDRYNLLRDILGGLGSNKKYQEELELLTDDIKLALIAEDLDLKWAYEMVFDILGELDKLYSLEKDKLGLVDYSDLEFKSYELLKNNRELRQFYQEKYSYIMVDEFQDTNRIQKEIFYLLASENKALDRKNLFVVGDPKQSIYGFRGADVSVFYDTMDLVSAYPDSEIINMDQNFRSLDSLISFVNQVFSQIMGDKYLALKAFHKSPNAIDVEVIEEEVEKSLDKDYEAYVVARRIRDLVENEGYNYRDIAILFRSSPNMGLYEKYLSSLDIPYYNSRDISIFDRQEIVDILNVFKLLSNSHDILSFLGFLRSPMVGLKDESIYYIARSLEEEGDPKEVDLEGRELEKYREALDLIEDLVMKKDLYNILELLDMILEKTDYSKLVLLYSDGLQRFSNIRSFRDLIKKYIVEENGDLEGFIDYVDSYEKHDRGLNQAKIKSESSDVVKLMTIHSSKGLQFPVVVLAEMSKSGSSPSLLMNYNNDYGMGLKYNSKSGYYNRIAEYNRDLDAREMERLLYVAMTRAEKLLILGNQGNNSGFKALISKLDSVDNYRNISYPMEEVEKKTSFKNLGPLLEETKEFELESIREYDNYRGRGFYNINMSQYMEFKNCKRSYYHSFYKPFPSNFRNLDFVGKNILEPTLRGDLVHRFSELYRGEDRQDLLKEVLEEMEVTYSPEVEMELRGYIDNYIDFYQGKLGSYQEVYSEKTFYLSLASSFIIGVIDRIYIIDGKAYIYDFKTNKTDDLQSLKSHYSPQLQIYAKAFEEIYGIEVARASLLFLETGEEVEVDISPLKIEETLLGLEEFLNYIENNSRLEDYPRSESCSFRCKYSRLCYGK